MIMYLINFNQFKLIYQTCDLSCGLNGFNAIFYFNYMIKNENQTKTNLILKVEIEKIKKSSKT